MGWSRLLITAGVLLAASLTWDIPVLDPVILALVMILVIAWVWNKLTLSGIGYERSLVLDRVNVGDPVVEEITVFNRSRIPKLWVQVDDHSTLPGHESLSLIHI